MPMEPCTRDIHTSALTSSGVGITLAFTWVHSMKFHTTFLPAAHFTSRSTPRATYQSLPLTMSVLVTG